MAGGYLRQVALLEHLETTHAARLRALFETREYRAREKIAEGPEFATALYFIDGGVVRLSATPGFAPPHDVLLATGDLFGALPSFQAEQIWGAEAVSAATVRTVDQAAFSDLLSQYPALGNEVLSILFAHAIALQQRLEALASEQPTERLVALLLRLGAHHGLVEGKDVLLRMKLTHADLSRMTGVPASLVRSLLVQWQRLGALSRARDVWRMDPAQLRALSAHGTPTDEARMAQSHGSAAE